MRPQSEEEALLHQNIWISDVWVCPSVSSHWLQPLARALAFWNNFQMNTTMPFPRLTTLFSLLGYVAINSHSQVLSLAIYSELISRLISLREIFYFQILGRRLTETNTTSSKDFLVSSAASHFLQLIKCRESACKRSPRVFGSMGLTWCVRIRS